jgi:hypothetical protein
MGANPPTRDDRRAARRGRRGVLLAFEKLRSSDAAAGDNARLNPNMVPAQGHASGRSTMFDSFRPAGHPKHLWLALLVIGLIGLIGLLLLGVH